jgi:solute:Na+ symporter, SSS family
VATALRWSWFWQTVTGGTRSAPFTGSGPVLFAKTALTTAAITTLAWVVVTLLTRSEPEDLLLDFYRKIRPDYRGWRRIAILAPEVPRTRDLGANTIAWLLGCATVYLALFGIGKLLFKDVATGLGLLALAAVAAVALYRRLGHPEPALTPQ